MLLIRSLGPPKERFKCILQLGRATRSVKLSEFHSTVQPNRINLRVPELNCLEGPELKKCLGKIDLNQPSRIVKRIDLYAVAVFPVAVALRLVPVLQSPQGIHAI